MADSTTAKPRANGRVKTMLAATRANDRKSALLTLLETCAKALDECKDPAARGPLMNRYLDIEARYWALVGGKDTEDAPNPLAAYMQGDAN